MIKVRPFTKTYTAADLLPELKARLQVGTLKRVDQYWLVQEIERLRGMLSLLSEAHVDKI